MIKIIKHQHLIEKPIDDINRYDSLINLLDNKSAIVYHGTTSYFKKFDMSKNRSDLNSKFYGDGLFFTPDKKVGWQYAYASRNMGISVDVISNLKSKNKNAGDFLYDLYKYGDDAWVLPKYLDKDGRTKLEDLIKGIDRNELGDVAQWIIGSKIKPIIDVGFDIFNSKAFMPTYILKILVDWKIDKQYIPFPRLYTVKLDATKKIIASRNPTSKEKRENDIIIFTGENTTVGNVPEIVVYNENLVHISHIEEDERINYSE